MLNAQPAGLRLSKETMETLEVEVEFLDFNYFFKGDIMIGAIIAWGIGIFLFLAIMFLVICSAFACY